MRSATTFPKLSLLAGLALAALACGDDVPTDHPGTGGSTTGTSTSTSTSTSGGLDCYPNPTTHIEIINACTDAQAIDVNPALPLLEPDGSLPPLP